jgi:hypothetical protein
MESLVSFSAAQQVSAPFKETLRTRPRHASGQTLWWQQTQLITDPPVISGGSVAPNTGTGSAGGSTPDVATPLVRRRATDARRVTSRPIRSHPAPCFVQATRPLKMAFELCEMLHARYLRARVRVPLLVSILGRGGGSNVQENKADYRRRGCRAAHVRHCHSNSRIGTSEQEDDPRVLSCFEIRAGATPRTRPAANRQRLRSSHIIKSIILAETVAG